MVVWFEYKAYCLHAAELIMQLRLCKHALSSQTLCSRQWAVIICRLDNVGIKEVGFSSLFVLK